MKTQYDTKQISDFAQLVTRFRQKHDMSQGQLAQATRLSRTYVYHLETGQRTNPSPAVVQNIVRALELTLEERNHLYDAYTQLTGQYIDSELFEGTLLDMGELARLLVHNTSYPAHSQTVSGFCIPGIQRQQRFLKYRKQSGKGINCIY